MNQTAPCLFELGTQDLPAKQLSMIRRTFTEGVTERLKALELKFTRIESFITPRRIAVLIHDLDTQQSDRRIERRGPTLGADGQPTPAALGFAKSCGVSLDELQRVETDKGISLVYAVTQPGKSTRELLPELFEQALKACPLPKTMRWGDDDLSFSRPSQWCLLRQGSEVIEGRILGQNCGTNTFGHRFHHPDAIRIDNVMEYREKLKQAFVIVDPDERQQLILEQCHHLGEQEKATVVLEPELLEEVTGLIEWPVALVASFDPEFLTVPQEALIAAMRDHQKSFALRADGHLIAKFITVSNIKSRDPKRVIEGNERVMRARLSDAAFFYKTDRKQRLDSHLEQTKNVVFQAKLGSLFDKSQRVAFVASHIAQKLHADVKLSFRAGELCKCDLLTNMVGEFPELQGIMGEDYARQDGEDPAVAIALREQYYPAFAGDRLPETPIGCAVALAERLDTLVGTFGIGQKPTGVKDPFKCRRAALGVVRIIIEKQCALDILDLLSVSLQQYPSLSTKLDIIHDVHEFILERLQAYYAEQGIRADVLAAVLTRQNSDLLDLHQRIQAVLQFRQLVEADALAAANKRVSRILQKENQEDCINGVDHQLLQDEAERSLANLINEKKHLITPLYEQGDYAQVLLALAGLRQPIDQFFDKVMVNVDDEKIRHNRLALLADLRRLFLQVADISLLQEL